MAHEELLAIDKVRAWLTSMVIGLNLCPFAEAPFKAGRVRFAVCEGNDPEKILEAIGHELLKLAGAERSECETTLLIAPDSFPDFLDFNDFVGVAEALVEDLNLAGTIQLVGFHPGFRYADAPEEAPQNYTNRSPYPLIHLLREESISEAAASGMDLTLIPQRNTATLEALGIEGIRNKLREGMN